MRQPDKATWVTRALPPPPRCSRPGERDRSLKRQPASARSLQVAVIEGYSDVVGGSHVVWRDLAAAGRSGGGWSTTVVLPREQAAAVWLRENNVDARVVAAPQALVRFGGSWRPGIARVLVALPRYWWQLARVLRGFDLVHVSDLRGFILGAPAAVLARRPWLVHIHNGEVGGGPFRLLIALLLRRGVVLVVPSRQGARGWARRHTGRLVELANPVPGKPLRVEAEKAVVVTIARLHPDKGIDVLLEAGRLLAQRGDPPRIVVIGADAPGLEDLGESLRATAQAAPYVTFTGAVADPTAVLSTAWVYVQPSLREPFGLAALEASAAGLPVVASRVGGLVDVVVDGVTGLLVQPGDPTALAAGIQSLIESPAERERLGTAGRERARQDFTRERFGLRLGQIYQRVMT